MLETKHYTIEEAKTLFPTTAYKYRDWANSHHKTIITKQEVYFASAKELHALGDEFDCRYPIDWDFSFEMSRPALEAGFPGDKSTMLKRDYEFSLRQYHREVVGRKDLQENYIHKYYDLSTRLIGVLSMTLRNDNAKIWESNYAMDYNGFCVAIDFSKCIYDLTKSGIGGGEIMYVPQDYPKIVHRSFHGNPEEAAYMVMQQVHYKYDKYDFEEEYRLTKRLYEKGLDYKLTLADRLFKVPTFCFKSVTFGYKMLITSIKEIMEACVDQHLNVQFLIATPDGAGNVLIERYPKTTI